MYFTGGATAVLEGWRSSTIDVDVTIVPETDRLFRTLPDLKEELQINVELVSPADFIPVPPGWEERSRFVAQEGQVTFLHFDPYAQALAKIERGHRQDLEDVQEMLGRGLVNRDRLWEYFDRIQPDLYRYPAVDGPTFQRAVEQVLGPRP